MSRTVEDFLARRVRALFLNADAATAMAPQVAQMAHELGFDQRWKEEQVRSFNELAEQYKASPRLKQVLNTVPAAQWMLRAQYFLRSAEKFCF